MEKHIKTLTQIRNILAMEHGIKGQAYTRLGKLIDELKGENEPVTNESTEQEIPVVTDPMVQLEQPSEATQPTEDAPTVNEVDEQEISGTTDGDEGATPAEAETQAGEDGTEEETEEPTAEEVASNPEVSIEQEEKQEQEVEQPKKKGGRPKKN